MPKTYVTAIPILPEKVEQWKAFAQALKTDKQREYELAHQKAGVRSEKIWHQPTPHGDLMLQVVELEGSYPDFMRSITHPSDEFGQWFLAQVQELHGVTAEEMEAMTPNEQILAWTCPTVFEKAGETAMGIGQNLAHTAQDILGKASETAEEVGKKVSENAGSFAGKAQQQAQEAAHQFQEKAQEASHQFQEKAQEAAHKVQQQAGEVRKQVEVKATELLNQAGDNVAEAAQQMQVKAAEALENAAEVGQAVAEKASGLLNQALGGIFGKKDDKAEETKTEVAKTETPAEEKKV